MADRKPFGSFAPDDLPPEYAQNFARNEPYVRPIPATYNTDLGAMEPPFRAWVAKNKVPFNPDAPVTDYDMRGFYRALVGGDPRAASAVDPNDSRMHYPDYWKTPYHETFSAQSQWAAPVAPQWSGDDKLMSPGGRVIFDDRSPPKVLDPVSIMRSALNR